MTRHAFRFGTAVEGNWLLDEATPDRRMYQAKLVELFNYAVPENELKWNDWGWPKSRAKALHTLDWLAAHHIAVRGHNMIWPSWHNTPRSLRSLAGQPGQPGPLRQAVTDHILDIGRACAGKVVEWDVINESYDNHDITDILGRDSLAQWFRLAHQADPAARLVLNDYGYLSDPDAHAKLDYEESLIREFLKNGVPLGAIGMQGHFRAPLPSIPQALATLDRFAQLGLPIEVTEFDVNVADQDAQARYLRDMYTLLFSHPAVDGILMWGFWEKAHWLPRAALFRADWTIKPNGQAFLDLVQHQWMTHAKGAADAAGCYRVRAFLGDYQVIVKSAGKIATAAASLPRDGATVTVKID